MYLTTALYYNIWYLKRDSTARNTRSKTIVLNSLDTFDELIRQKFPEVVFTKIAEYLGNQSDDKKYEGHDKNRPKRITKPKT